jgi:hypothetical protein
MMLCQICWCGRLNALIANEASLVSSATSALKILIGVQVEPGSLSNQKRRGQRSQKIPSNEYEAIHLYLNSSAPISYRHHANLPHSLNAIILSPVALPLTHITHNDRVYSTSRLHAGNSSVLYKTQENRLEAGIICSIWQIMLPNLTKKTLLVIAPYERLSAVDSSSNPYLSQSGFLCNIVYHNPSPLPDRIIDATHIVSHLPFYDRPSGTFGIARSIRILINSVHRDRN